jgi:tRNA(Ile)-lysidine synthase
MSNRPPAFTAQRLLHILNALPAVNAYVVGFSGGADSTALLHALAAIREQLDVPVSAVHVNHGLHGDAGDWQSRCEQFCERHQIPLVSLDINPVTRSGKGLEAEARHLRYAAIASQVTTGTGLLTAHHADDQAETLLLNLMRGSGVDGLAAMPDSRPFGAGLLQRPLLEFRGSELRHYLRENGIEWAEDPSNQQVEHDRNFVRHEVIPLLEQRWPGVAQRLLLTRRAMSGARHLLEGLADAYLAQNLKHPLVLQIAPDAAADGELFKLVVRRWIKRAGMPSVPVYRLESLFEQVRCAGAGQQASMAWESCALRCYQQRLWLLPRGDIATCPARQWPDGASEIDLGDVGRLAFTGRSPGGLVSGLTTAKRSSLTAASVIRGGQHKSLKNIFQAAGIPAWLRDCIPLCCHAGEVVAVGDWCLSDRFTTLMDEHGTRLVWQPRNALLQFVHAQQMTGG